MEAPAVAHFRDGFLTGEGGVHSTFVCFQGSMNLGARVRAFRAVAEHECEEGKGAGSTAETDVVLGGRSMGSRAAVIAATDIMEERSADDGDDDCSAGGVAAAVRKELVLVSYPLRNEKGDVRDEILLAIPEGWDVLFISGDRDTMCDAEELRGVRARMKCRTWFVAVRDANHGMEVKPRRGTEGVGRMTGMVATKWLAQRDGAKTEMEISWDDDEEEARSGEWHTPEEGRLGEAGKGASESDPEKPSKANGKAKARISNKTKAKKNVQLAEEEDKNEEHNGSAEADEELTTPLTRKRKAANPASVKGRKSAKKEIQKAPEKRLAKANDGQNISSRTRQRRKL